MNFKNWKLIVLAVIVGIVALLVLRLFVNTAGATAPEPYATICHHNPSQNVTLEFANEQSYEGHLGTPHSDTVFDTEGACEEEPTDYCDTLEGVQAEDEDCPPVEEEVCPPGTHEVKNEAWEYEEEYELVCEPDEPTPTPEERCTENCGTPATFAGSTTNAPTGPFCVNEKYDAPELQGYGRVTPTSVQLNWWPSTDGADKQFVVYGYAEDQLVHATQENEVGKNDGNYTVNELEANKMAFFQVWSVKEGCVSKSQIIDP